MASPKNRHCANCIGTLSFPILSLLRGRPKYKRSLMLALDVAARPEVIDQRIVHIEPLARLSSGVTTHNWKIITNSHSQAEFGGQT